MNIFGFVGEKDWNISYGTDSESDVSYKNRTKMRISGSNPALSLDDSVQEF